MSIIEDPFIKYLSENRERCNNRFALLCGRTHPELAYGVIQDIIAPIIRDVPPESTTRIANYLIDSAFVLLRKGLIGAESRSQAVNQLWSRGLPKLLPHLIKAPKRVVGALTNAVFRLEQVSETVAVKWFEQLTDLSDDCSDVKTLLEVGQVLAWINGLSEYRESAILIWSRLTPKLQKATLGTEQPQFEERWSHPNHKDVTSAKLKFVGHIGGHVEFGGLFVDPPMVGIVNGKILAFDSKRYLTLHGDYFGVQARPYREEPEIEDLVLPKPIKVYRKGAVLWGGDRIETPELAQSTSVAFASQTLAVTVKHSFYIFLYARVAT